MLCIVGAMRVFCIRPVSARQAAPRADVRALARSWLRSVGTNSVRPQRAPREAATVARRATAAGERALQAVTDRGRLYRRPAARGGRPVVRTSRVALGFLSVNSVCVRLVRQFRGRAGALRALPARPGRVSQCLFARSEDGARSPPRRRAHEQRAATRRRAQPRLSLWRDRVSL